jgi:hypothetical protein
MTGILTFFAHSAVILLDLLRCRAWSFYPFVPPVFSVLFTLFILPVYNNLFFDRLRERLRLIQLTADKSHGTLEEKREFIENVILDRGLQVSYLTAIPSLVVALLATATQHGHYLFVFGLILVVMWVGPLMTLLVFLREPGFHASTKLDHPRWWKGDTYLSLYSRILISLNLLSIIAIILSLPTVADCAA